MNTNHIALGVLEYIFGLHFLVFCENYPFTMKEKATWVAIIEMMFLHLPQNSTTDHNSILPYFVDLNQCFLWT